MNTLHRSTLASLLLAACGAAWAQPIPQGEAAASEAPASASTTTQSGSVTTTTTPADDAPGQRVQQIRVEDRGANINEVRKGGETQSITVQPKTPGGSAPAYEVRPATGPGDMNRRHTSPGAAGERTWKVLEF